LLLVKVFEIGWLTRPVNAAEDVADRLVRRVLRYQSAKRI